MTHVEQISSNLGLKAGSVTAVINLLDDGNTIPFIARYRKEKTNSLDEEQIRDISKLVEKLRALDERRGTIIKSIDEQDKLTPKLKAELLAADSITVLEDLYLPYRPKRRTRATMAKEKGLEPLADFIQMQMHSRQNAAELAKPFLTDDVSTVEEALAGARDIVAETISDNAAVRQLLREKALQWGRLISTKIAKGEDEKGVYELYYDYSNKIDRLQPHQILAINRGETEKVLRVKVEIQERDWILAVRSGYKPDRRSPLSEQLKLAMDDAAMRLLIPAIERDVRRTLTETAESHAIHVFAQNLRGLLNQPPFAD
ncbi:MAG: Tex-like N-terminal domain-containing protein, partial [Chloroflexota bacterium]